MEENIYLRESDLREIEVDEKEWIEKGDLRESDEREIEVDLRESEVDEREWIEKGDLRESDEREIEVDEREWMKKGDLRESDLCEIEVDERQWTLGRRSETMRQNRSHRAMSHQRSTMIKTTSARRMGFDQEEGEGEGGEVKRRKKTKRKKKRIRSIEIVHEKEHDDEFYMEARAELLGIPVPGSKIEVEVIVKSPLSDARILCKFKLRPDDLIDSLVAKCYEKLNKKVKGSLNSVPIEEFGLVIQTPDGVNIECRDDFPLWKYDLHALRENFFIIAQEKSVRRNLFICVKYQKEYSYIRLKNNSTINGLLFRTFHEFSSLHKKEIPRSALYLHSSHWSGYLENSKTAADYDIEEMDIIEVKRKQVIEIIIPGETEILTVPSLALVSDIKISILDFLHIEDDPEEYSIKLPNKATEVSAMLNATDSSLFPLNAMSNQPLLVSTGDIICISNTTESFVQILVTNWTPEIIAKKDLEIKHLLDGEFIFKFVEDVPLYKKQFKRVYSGTLYFTNFRILFISDEDDVEFVPLTTISRYKMRTSKRKKDLLYLDIECKDFRDFSFKFLKESGTREKMIEALDQHLYPDIEILYCFNMKPKPYRINGWELYDPFEEYMRMGVGQMRNWELSSLNNDYSISTYPHLLVIPSGLGEDDLNDCMKFRSKSRIPVLSWVNDSTGAAIVRCSQPQVGLSNKTSSGDRAYLSKIASINPSGRLLEILDCRPKTNAIANIAVGGGFETLDDHYNCNLTFCNISNIHVMRESLSRMRNLVYEERGSSHFLSKLEDTEWLNHTSLILKACVNGVRMLSEEHSTLLVHCSDGWDRTPQFTALMMIMLDPYYRTIEGFAVLIEKEWLSFGHKFAQRNGHTAQAKIDSNHADSERSPVFLQFLDCVYQMTVQYPCAFEFNETLLIFIIDNVTSCKFGTFLFDTDMDRKKNDLQERTHSIWTEVYSNLEEYKNIFSQKSLSTLKISYHLEDLQVWRSYFYRYVESDIQTRMNQEIKTKQLILLNNELINQIAQLSSELELLKLNV